MKIIETIPIGSSSGGNSYLLKLGPHHLLIDMGLSCKKIREALNKNGIGLSDIDACFITHTHSDHIKGLTVLKKHLNCTIYASKTSLTHLKLDTSNALKYKDKTEVLEDLWVTPLKTSHDCPGSACYIFEYKNIKVSLVTDLGYMDMKIEEKMLGSDLVILESNHDEKMLKEGPYPYYLKERILSDDGHLSNYLCAQTVKYLESMGTKNFLLAHLSKENNKPELALEEVNKFGLDINIKVLAPESDEMLRYELED